MAPLLALRNIACTNEDDKPLFHDVNVLVEPGDILILQGKSGCGKTTLLKCIAHLRSHEGDVLYRGILPNAHGIPYFRTCVLYVPQRPSLLPGTPRDFIETVSKFKAHMPRNSQEGRQPNGWISSQTSSNGPFHINLERAMSIAGEWDIEAGLWDREWSNLSGGEGQRIALACALGLNTAEVLLLDEPTSALDSESTQLVEKLITEKVAGSDSVLKAVVWITHSDAQGHRVGTRFIHLSAGGCQEGQHIV